MSLDLETAVAEYQQESTLMPPGTMVAYTANVQPVVDFAQGYLAGSMDPLWEDFGCDWCGRSRFFEQV